MLIYISIAIYLMLKFNEAYGHGFLSEPAARSSAWKVDRRFPIYYNHMEMSCGGFFVQWNQNNGKCGICGENYALPRKFEKGGSYYVGIPVRRYLKGSSMEVNVELTANHEGYFEFRICNIDGLPGDASQDCLDKTLLSDTQKRTRVYITSSVTLFKTQLVLPANLVCKNCVLQWKYHTGNRWGIAPGQNSGCTGCALEQEEFYGCSDISIVERLLPMASAAEFEIRQPDEMFQNVVTESPETKYAGTCRNGDGYYANYASNCTSYYLCSETNTKNQAIIAYYCEEGKIFDDIAKNCNWPDKVNCTMP